MVPWWMPAWTAVGLVAAAIAPSSAQEGALLGRVREMEQQLSGSVAAQAIRSPKNWWYLDEAILSRVLEAAEATYLSNMKRRGRFLRFEQYHSEADVSHLAKIPVEALYVPTYPCALQKRLGDWVDGGKWLCFGHYRGAQGAPVVVSIGSRGDTSFEQLIYKNFGVHTSTFDFSLPPEVAERVSGLEYVKFFPVGLYGTDHSYRRPETTGVKWVNIFELMDLVGTRYIDIFKIDCEQCERGVFLDMQSRYTRDNVPFGQILVEFHLASMHWSTIQAMAILEGLGYRLFNSEINRFEMDSSRAHYELAFIHESLVVPRGDVA